MDNLLQGILQILIVVILSPLVNGIIKKVKAFSQKRKGPPVLQLYFDIYKLLKKGTVISKNTSWISIATPYIVLGSALVASFFVPVITKINLPSINGDIILVISVLALGRFFLTLGSLDAASTFGGMGASRETMVSFLFEPALLISIFTMGLISNTTSITGIFKYSESLGLDVIKPVYILLFFALCVILIAETARIPVDDPATHLELTMIHEAMTLEYSGKYLAFIELSASIKQFIFLTIICNTFIPVNIEGFFVYGVSAFILALFIFIVKVCFMSVIIGLSEVLSVKTRLFRITDLAAFSVMASFTAFLEYFVLGGN